MASPAKLVILGIDAGDKDLILRWASQGLLPNFRRALERGTWGIIENPPGMEAGSVWPSFYTGVSAAKHGMYCADETRKRGTYQSRPFTANDFSGEPFWDRLSRAGKRVAVIDAPHTFLSQSINGIHIVDWATHAPMMTSKEPGHAFQVAPFELKSDIAQYFGLDTIGRCDLLELKTADHYRSFRDDLLERVRRKTGLNLFILQQGNWDCFFSVYHEAHCAGHHCWHFHDPKHPRHDPEMVAELGDIMQQVYGVIDEGIGRLLDFVGPQARVLIYCSHGMSAGYNGSLMLDDVLLHLEGLDPIAWGKSIVRGANRRWNRLPKPMKGLLTPLGADLWPALRSTFLDPYPHDRKCFEVRNNDTCSGIRLNLIGREPKGKLEPGEDADAFCEQLTTDLLALKILGTDIPAVTRVVRTDEVYCGSRRDELPDLLVDWNREVPIYGVWSIKFGFVENKDLPTRTGGHNPSGMVCALGPDYPTCKLNAPVSVYNFAPTIARILGIELTADELAAEPLLGADTPKKGADAA
jgi:predicted AlkP superfamily phosphohydrolase/phosphomutase